MPLSVISVESTELFVGSHHDPVQVVRVSYTGATAPAAVHIEGDGLAGQADITPGDGVLEVPVTVADPQPGRQRAATAIVGEQRLDFAFTDAEPGWTMSSTSDPSDMAGSTGARISRTSPTRSGFDDRSRVDARGIPRITHNHTVGTVAILRALTPAKVVPSRPNAPF